MKRFFYGGLGLMLALGSVQAQGRAYTPLPPRESDPEALKRLAAMLGNGNETPPSNIDPKLIDFVQRLWNSTENDPQARQKLLDAVRQQAADNSPQFRNLAKQANPQLSDADLEKLRQSIGKPGDALPQLPKPGERPKADPPKPMGTTPNPKPNQNDPKPPNDPSAQPRPVPQPVPSQTPPSKHPGQPNSNAEQVQGAVQMWEQTVGPIDSTPAVKDAIVDLFGHGTGGPNEKPFWDSPDFNGTPSSSSSGSSFWKSLSGGAGGGPNWTAPSWMKNFKTSAPSAPSAPKAGFNSPSAPSFGGFGGAGLAGLGSLGTVVLVLVVAAVVGFLIWKFLPLIREARNRRLQPLPGQGPWPVDPRTIRDREGLVRAFEYLSVLVCGNGAVVWNHVTIAEALREALPDREHLAEPLARLYAVARYTPLREEIPESAFAEARRCLCQLAGVPER